MTKKRFYSVYNRSKDDAPDKFYKVFLHSRICQNSENLFE